MAKIEMDISEYEAMKENKKLLENSLEKERKLQEEVKRLSDEKVKALEDAKMKVVKVKKIVNEDFLIKKKPDSESVRRFLNILGFGTGYVNAVDIDDALNCISHRNLQDIFFEKVHSTSEGFESVTTHGLDDITAEIRKEINDSIDSKTKSKLEEFDKLSQKNSEYLKRIEDLEKTNSNLDKENNKLSKSLTEALKKADELDENSRKFYRVKNALKNGYGFWGKANLLEELIEIVKK